MKTDCIGGRELGARSQFKAVPGSEQATETFPCASAAMLRICRWRGCCATAGHANKASIRRRRISHGYEGKRNLSILMSVPLVSGMSLPRLLDVARGPGRLFLVTFRCVVYRAVGALARNTVGRLWSNIPRFPTRVTNANLSPKAMDRSDSLTRQLQSFSAGEREIAESILREVLPELAFSTKRPTPSTTQTSKRRKPSHCGSRCKEQFSLIEDFWGLPIGLPGPTPGQGGSTLNLGFCEHGLALAKGESGKSAAKSSGGAAVVCTHRGSPVNPRNCDSWPNPIIRKFIG